MYFISKHEKNCWHPDGSPVIPKNYLETTRWKDVLKWWRDNFQTTACLDAHLWIDDEHCGEMSILMTIDPFHDYPNLRDVKKYIQEEKNFFGIPA